jgi:hypothetical protein
MRIHGGEPPASHCDAHQPVGVPDLGGGEQVLLSCQEELERRGHDVVLFNQWSDRLTGHNMRTFEIPASGGLMLATYTPEQAEFVPEGEATMYYRGPYELEAHIDRALHDRAWSARLRAKAPDIAAEHTYAARMRTMLGELPQ